MIKNKRKIGEAKNYPIAQNEIGKRTVVLGLTGEFLVKEKLWNYNYKVKHFHQGEFDLLVDEKIKVEVKSSMMSVQGQWQFNLPRIDKADIFAFVFFYPDGNKEIRFIKKNLLPKDKKSIILTPNDSKLEKSPLKIFK